MTCQKIYNLDKKNNFKFNLNYFRLLGQSKDAFDELCSAPKRKSAASSGLTGAAKKSRNSSKRSVSAGKKSLQVLSEEAESED